MRPEPVRVAIDLETTGLRPEQDAIIEIGAVKFAGAQRLDTFQSFVNITSQLPYRIHRLTGITSADLRHAPTLGSLLGDLRAFIGTAPLVGHSVSFDASFLRKVGLAHRNPLIDTYELASLLLPSLPSYTLGSVADALHVTSSIHHRALADADLSRAVFLALMERLDALDTSVINELAATPAAPGWSPAYLIKAQARDRAETIQSSPFAALLKTPRSTREVAPGMSADALSLAVALQPEPTSIPAPTEAQTTTREDAREPWTSLQTFVRAGAPLLLELEPTDAALLSALGELVRGAVASGERVTVAASDADEMKRVARVLAPQAIASAGLSAERVTVAEVDEREGYLCLSRWFGVARDDRGLPFSPELTRGLAKLAVWTRDTTTGMRADVSLSGGDSEAWARVRSGPEFADTLAACPYRDAGLCFAERAVRRAADATITVTTHAALAASLAKRDTLLPEAPRVIILDGRQFEDEARRQLTVALDAASLFNLLDSLSMPGANDKSGGLLPLIARMTDKTPEVQWTAAVERGRETASDFFTALRAVQQEGPERGGRGAQRGEPADGGSLRIDEDLRASRGWNAAHRQWHALSVALASLIQTLDEAADALGTTPTQPREHGAWADARAMARRLGDLIARGDAIMAGHGGEQTVQWLRVPQQFAPTDQQRGRRPNGRGQQNGADSASDVAKDAEVDTRSPREILIAEAPALFSAPTQIGSLLASLLAEGRGVAVLGWALSVGGDFEYVRVTLGMPETTHAVSSTPDFSRQTLLCLPSDAPEPNAQSYHTQLETLIVSLAQALAGDVVAVFPSHAALRSAAMGIRRSLERHDILVLAQGIDGSARQLWNTFNTQPRTVLLGAGSFWDGGRQGDRAPACVVAPRTPFPPQSDPLVAARSDLWPDPQAQFMTPQAALKLRQALGGLAWSSSRRNAVVLFDRRLQTRSYGDTILGALPKCELYHDVASELADAVAAWTRQPVSPTPDAPTITTITE